MDAAAVVVVHRQAEALGAARDARCRSGPCRRCPAACPRCGGPASRSGPSRVHSPARTSRSPSASRRGDGEDQRHGHVGGVLGQDARRVGDGDAALAGGLEVDVVDAGAEDWRSASALARRAASTAASMRSVTVGTSTSACCDRLDQLGLAHRLCRRGSAARRTAPSSGSRSTSGSLRVTTTRGRVRGMVRSPACPFRAVSRP